MSLKKLIDKRNDILMAEIGALIHDLGKLSKEFVEGKDDNEEKDKDNVKKFRHEKIWIYLNVIQTNNSFFKRLTELIIKKDPINRLNQLKGKVNSINKDTIYFSDLPNWAKSDQLLKNSGNIRKQEMANFINNLEENTAILKYSYMKNDFFVLQDDLLNICYHVNLFNNWPLVLLPVHHHRNDRKISGYDIETLPQESKLILAPFGADGIDSAIDKMVSDNCNIVKQSRDNVFISTAFGYENQKIDLSLSDTDAKSLTKKRQDYSNQLSNILNELNGESELKPEKWIENREKILKATKEAFLNTLGETRHPANDVTLWDHSFSVASLYKAALAEVIIDEWKEPKDIKWKLLSIRFDGDSFYYSVPKIADILGRKTLVKKILDNIKYLLEVVIPIGNEIYRDENGSVFLVPESVEENKIFEINPHENSWETINETEFELKLSTEGEWKKEKLEKVFSTNGVSVKPTTIEEIIRKVSSHISNRIFVPQISVSDSLRGALNLGDAISKTQKHGIDVNKLRDEWQNKEQGYEKCTVCGLRPIPSKHENEKAYERKCCEDCLNLASDRVKEWSKNWNNNENKWSKKEPEKPSFDTSIWLDEVADDNNRIALVYSSFDLSKWLNGEMLNTFLSKPLLDNEFKRSFENELANVANFNQLIRLIEESFNKGSFDEKLSVHKRDGNSLKVSEFFSRVLGCYIRNNGSPSDVFTEIIEQRESDWQTKYQPPQGITVGSDKHKAFVFLLHLTRKHPSFARLRRIWETTRNFGIDIFEKAKNEHLTEKNRIILSFDNKDSLKITHTYWFKDKKGRKCELAIIRDKGTAAIISAPSDFELPKTMELYDERFKTYLYTLANVQEKQKVSYTPLIPYQFEPSKTLFFMPLKDVWKVITFIKKEYEIQFNKVQNRLPIRIGFVAFHKKMPMYAVLDAAKKMYSGEIEKKEYEVCSVKEMDEKKKRKIFGEDWAGTAIGKNVKEIKFADSSYEYHFSYSTGDPDKEDLYHPYFIVENNNDWKVYVEGGWKTIKHVKDLKEGDKVSFYPSYFDFLYLDTNIRRLDAGNSNKIRKHWLFRKTSPKPYDLKAIDDFERLKKLLLGNLSLTASQLLNAYGLLIEKMREWKIDETENLPVNDSVLEEFVSNMILNIPFRLKKDSVTQKGKIKDEDFEFLKKCMLNGVFIDFIDMWHTVLKRKFKEENNG